MILPGDKKLKNEINIESIGHPETITVFADESASNHPQHIKKTAKSRALAMSFVPLFIWLGIYEFNLHQEDGAVLFVAVWWMLLHLIFGLLQAFIWHLIPGKTVQYFK